MKLSPLLQVVLATSAACHQRSQSKPLEARSLATRELFGDPLPCKTNDDCQHSIDGNRRCRFEYLNVPGDDEAVEYDISIRLGVGECHDEECWCITPDNPTTNLQFCRDLFSRTGDPGLDIVAGCQFPKPGGPPWLKVGQCMFTCKNIGTCKEIGKVIKLRKDGRPQKFYSDPPTCPGFTE